MTDTDWIQWNGGPCPVEPETRVEVRLRQAQHPFDAIEAWEFDWESDGLCSDIIAYRIAKEKQG